MSSQNMELSLPLLSKIEEINLLNLKVTPAEYIPSLKFLEELDLNYSENELKNYAKKIGRNIYVFDVEKDKITWKFFTIFFFFISYCFIE